MATRKEVTEQGDTESNQQPKESGAEPQDQELATSQPVGQVPVEETVFEGMPREEPWTVDGITLSPTAQLTPIATAEVVKDDSPQITHDMLNPAFGAPHEDQPKLDQQTDQKNPDADAKAGERNKK